VSRRPAGPVVLTVAAVILLAATLRVAVASLSPVLDLVGQDFAVPTAVVGVIGATPLLAFAVFGILTPMLARRASLEALAASAAALTAVGLVARALTGDAAGLLLTSMLIFAGVGVGNVLMPGLIKKYFPSSIALMTTVYISMLSLGTFLPPVFAVPLADAAGWRVSLGVWAVVALSAVVPWVTLLRRDRSRTADGALVEETNPAALRRLVRLPRTWAMVAAMTVNSATAYSGFAWLPAILQERSGVDAATAGALLGLFAVMGLPFSLVIPWLVARFHAITPIVLAAILPGLVGVVGLLAAPAALPALWVVLLSLPTAFFPLILVLCGLRTRTHATTVALSAVAQGTGYAVAAMFPLALGVLHEATGSWESSLWLLGGLFLVGLPAGLIAGRPGTVEDVWERRHGPW
jgi:MFS transporter, CP family, cyanate transporter